MVRDFRAVAGQIVDDLLDGDPVRALWAGDHRHDDRLPDYSADTVRAEVARLREDADVLAEVDPDALEGEEAVDLQLLSSAVDARLFELTETAEHEWNPLVHNVGVLFHGLLVRDFAPAGERLESVLGRLRALPEALRTAETVLTDCPTVHVETALSQLGGTVALVTGEVSALAAKAPALAPEVRSGQRDAVEAL
jgi:uncharacterized protein (DUF885 family)